jgi:hypothetical protein
MPLPPRLLLSEAVTVARVGPDLADAWPERERVGPDSGPGTESARSGTASDEPLEERASADDLEVGDVGLEQVVIARDQHCSGGLREGDEVVVTRVACRALDNRGIGWITASLRSISMKSATSSGVT